MNELEIAAQPVKGVDELSRISELLAGDSPEKQPDDDAGPANEPEVADPPPAPEMAPDEPEPAAAETPAEPLEVDYDQVVPMPDGAESVTIGQLKDHYQGKADFETERETWNNTRQDQQAETIAAKQQLYDLAALIGNTNPALVQHMQQQQQATRQTEAKRLIEIYPEWADPEVKKAQNPRLLKAAKYLGFSEAEYAISGDHRQIRALVMIADGMEAREKAEAKVAELKPDLPKGQKPNQRKQTKAQATQAIIDRGKNGTPDEKREAVAALFRG
jgi:hypothetical protein